MSGENACGECGRPAPVLRVLGQELRLPFCEECSPAVSEREDALDRRRSLDRALERAGATPRLLAQSFATYPADGRAAVEAAEAWLADPVRNLWLSGPVGTGKTGLAWSIVRRMTEDAVSAYWAIPAADRPAQPTSAAMLLRWADLLDDLREAFAAEARARAGGEAADPSLLLDRARRVRVLALDDLGRERPTPWALERLASLVEARYQRMVPTIVTSNYGSRELAGRLAEEGKLTEAERIVSRLVEDAASYRFTGPSRRRAAA